MSRKIVAGKPISEKPVDVQSSAKPDQEQIVNRELPHWIEYFLATLSPLEETDKITSKLKQDFPEWAKKYGGSLACTICVLVICPTVMRWLVKVIPVIKALTWLIDLMRN